MKEPTIPKDHLLKENEDFVLIPLDNDPDGWGVRFLTGPFNETVVKFGTVKMDGNDGCLKFNYDIVSSPDSELFEENKELVAHATKVLCAIIVDAAEEETLEITEE
jgi:hypothetical protein